MQSSFCKEWVDCPLSICNFCQYPQIRNVFSLCIRYTEPSNSLISDGPSENKPFPVDIASDSDGPTECMMFSVYGFTEYVLNLQQSSKSCSLSILPILDQYSLCWGLNSPILDIIRFQLRFRSRQLGSVNSGSRKSQWLFFNISKAKMWQNRQSCFKSKWQDFSKPMFLVILRVLSCFTQKYAPSGWMIISF